VPKHVSILALDIKYFSHIKRFDYLSRDLVSRCVVLLMFIGGFFIPFVVILVLYSLLMKEVNEKNRLLFKRTSGERISTTFITTTNTVTKQPIVKLSTCSCDETCTKKDLMLENNSFIRNYHVAVTTTTTTSAASTNQGVASSDRHQLTNDRTSKSQMNGVLNRRTRRVARRVILYLVVFCVTWLPYSVVVMIAQYGSDVQAYVTPLTASLPSLLAKLSTVLNPIIYTLTNPDFKMCLIKKWRSICS
jgi:hypothetical protein